MKNLFNGLKPIYQIVILNLAGGLAINFILNSNIFENTKISLSIIVGVVLSLYIISIFNKAQARGQQQNIENMDIKFTEYFEKLQAIANQTQEKLSDECKAIEEENQRLKQLQSTFPLIINRGYIIYSIVMEGYNPFVDTDWIISGEHNGQIFACKITRHDTQTIDDLIKNISDTRCPDEIYQLDQYEIIYPNGEEEAS